MPDTRVEINTFVDALRRRAHERPGALAFTFLADGEDDEVSITVDELDRRARSIGALLQSIVREGDRALLLYPPGLDYIAAFMGCLYAGAVAVPAYPPRPNRNLSRFEAMMKDAEATVGLGTSPIISRVRKAFINDYRFESMTLLSTDELETGLEMEWRHPSIGGDTLAFLQYTSGSTGDPKGVMLTHNNLLHNSAMLKVGFRYNPESHCVSWLPPYHDMGLIGGVLQPLYGGFHCTLMSPLTFLQSPVKWLRAITRYKATISGAPNFAYDLCVRKISSEKRARLDLSSWQVAFTGAEPIRADTLDNFAEAFKPYGFRRESFYPCYGLAEATLFVSGGTKSSSPAIKTVLAKSIEKNRVAEANEDEGEIRRLVGCGGALLDQRIVIAHPDSMTECSSDEVGEVWVSSASVARGYWNKVAETEQIFRARLADTQEGPFLRTGDLGFIKGDQLFITGRLKDLIIIRGVNHYPQDIELTVERAHPALRPGCGAVVSIEVAGQESLVVIQEVGSPRFEGGDQLIEIIRQAIAQEHEAQPQAIVLVTPGSISKTTSGKIQRHLCRARFLEGSLDVVSKWQANTSHEIGRESIEKQNLSGDPKDFEQWLASYLETVLGIDGANIDMDQSLTRLGGDSLMITELMHKIEVDFGVSSPVALFFESPSVRYIAEQLRALVNSSSPPQYSFSSESDSADQYAMSYGQQALWFLQALAPQSSAYNIPAAARIRGPLDVDICKRAFQKIVDRHDSLRAVFVSDQGKIVQSRNKWAEIHFRLEDAALWSESSLNEKLNAEAHRPFDLEIGPLMRVTLFIRSQEECLLLLVAHHIISDFWSLAVLLHDLRLFYEAEKKQKFLSLPPLNAQYCDYVRWQREMLQSEKGKRLWKYWKERLRGDLPILNLPTDRPRSAINSYPGASVSSKISVELTERLKLLSGYYQVSLYMMLLAAFKALLNRYSGQEDILIGSPTSGRSKAEWADLIGYFVNPVALRSHLSPNLAFDSFLTQIRQTVIEAFEHADYPFQLLVERLRPQRDSSRSTLFQVMFIFQKAHKFGTEGLSGFALGEGGVIEFADLTVESVGLKQSVAQFELTLVMAEVKGELAISLQYNTDLFDESTIARMAGHFKTLLGAIAASPGEQLSRLPLLTEEERRQLLVEWNATQSDQFHDACIHNLFEVEAERNPHAIALIFEEQQLTYFELNYRANQVARYLRAIGAETEMLVGICMDRSPALIVGLLGILKSGAAYLPINPADPEERITFICEDAGTPILITQQSLRRRPMAPAAKIVCLDEDWPLIACESGENINIGMATDHLAYTIYTSGSTGKPKGVMISHYNVTNFFAGMDERIDRGGKFIGKNEAALAGIEPNLCSHPVLVNDAASEQTHRAPALNQQAQIARRPDDTILAVTGVSFDISVLELFWCLTRGVKIILLTEGQVAMVTTHPALNKNLQFSLFFFASEVKDANGDDYRLLLEAAKFADHNGFTAIWTPERHFHAFGGAFPNPSVISAAIAMLTRRLQIRAGSVVLPLHNPIRIAEEWSLVDNLSGGRVGIAFASGWHSDDFVFSPNSYANRKEITFAGIRTIQKLWRGEAEKALGGAGNEIEVRIFPKPVQAELPIWVTAAGSAETFVKAGEIGANVLTHFLMQDIEDLTAQIKVYRDSLAAHGHRHPGHVTLMMHTFISENMDYVLKKVREPFINYLRSSVGLISNLIKSLDLPLDLKTMSKDDLEDLLAFAFDRYFQSGALFGTPETCITRIEELKAIGVDEVACLIDFGIDTDSVLESLYHLRSLNGRSNIYKRAADYSLQAQAVMYKPTLMQCTPSMMKMFMLNQETIDSLKSLRLLMLGGEELPLSLARRIDTQLPAKLINMYGPTETTIWSMTHELDEETGSVPIGRPIINTQVYILDDQFQPAPIRAPGQLCIGGAGLARCYSHHPEMTAERFIPDAFSGRPGMRIYKTGDLTRYKPDGLIEFLGRIDYQVKIRGHRIELSEIEIILEQHPVVREAVVTPREDHPGDMRLIAYVVLEQYAAVEPETLRKYLQAKLPEYMVPSLFVELSAMPQTYNGKVDRKTLPAPNARDLKPKDRIIEPGNKMEQTIAAIWRKALNVETVSVDDNFFDIGGHSLLMAQVHSQIQKALHRNLPLIKILEHPTIGSLAKYLERELSDELSLRESQERASKQISRLMRRRRDARAEYKTE
jgi:natural product biosynthesis luciferase-like monooxygenase protein